MDRREAYRTTLDARLDLAQGRRADREHRHNQLITAGLRLLLVLAALGGTLWLMVSQRRRGSRWVIAGYAGVGAAAALALVMGIDYLGQAAGPSSAADLTGWFDPVQLGPLVLSLIGTLFTLLAMAALRRYLARRLPGRRVRRGECPFCGFPAGRGDTARAVAARSPRPARAAPCHGGSAHHIARRAARPDGGHPRARS